MKRVHDPAAYPFKLMHGQRPLPDQYMEFCAWKAPEGYCHHGPEAKGENTQMYLVTGYSQR